MKFLIAPAVAIALLCPGAVYAQSSGGNNASGTQANAPSNASDQKALANAQKLKQDLQNAGFTDVNVVAESFVVQAKTKDGDPVVMTIGPHGMTVFEAINGKSGNTNATGSTGSSGSSGTSAGSASSGHK